MLCFCLLPAAAAPVLLQDNVKGLTVPPSNWSAQIRLFRFKPRAYDIQAPENVVPCLQDPGSPRCAYKLHVAADSKTSLYVAVSCFAARFFKQTRVISPYRILEALHISYSAASFCDITWSNSLQKDVLKGPRPPPAWRLRADAVSNTSTPRHELPTQKCRIISSLS